MTWWIRCWRNDKVFNGTNVCWNQKTIHLNRYLKEIIGAWARVEELQNGLMFKHEARIGWKQSYHPKIKINSDSAAKGNPGLASAGCVLRDAGKVDGWCGAEPWYHDIS